MGEGQAVPPPPAGFTLSPPRGGYSSHNGPYFDGPEGEGARRAFYSLPRHANSLGVVHGGMLTSFMDGLLAGAVALETRKIGLTAHLSIDFLHMARVGEWVIGEARMTRATKDIAFAEGRLHIGGRDILRGSGVFKLMHRRD